MSLGSVTVSHEHAQYQDLETDAAKWNSAVVHFIIYFTSALFLLRHVKMSSLRKVYLHKAHFLRDFNVKAHMSSKWNVKDQEHY